MYYYHYRRPSCFFRTIWQWFCVLLTFHLAHSQQILTAQVTLSNPGTQFMPASMSAQLISSTLVDAVKKCMMKCLLDSLCRVYDYEAYASKQCRLFEGDSNEHGQIISSPSPQSLTGIIRLSTDLFIEYGRPCSSFCHHSRYLQCGLNFTCDCMPHTYWDSSVSMCFAQSPVLGAPCRQNTSMCREDLNYTCLQYNQCGRKLYE